MTEKEFLDLLTKHKKGNLGEKEQLLLAQAVADGNFDELLKQDVWQSLSGEAPEKHSLIRRLLTNPYRIAAAMAIMVMSSLLFLFVFRFKKQDNPPQLSLAVTNDVAPGSNKALLTLADGTVVELDSLGNVVIPAQGNSNVNVQSGQLVYSNKGKSERQQLFNTLSTPKGAQYKIQLSDGTLVWLNAGSSLKYPTLFSKNERLVELQGEAYFEVAKDARKVFQVKVNEMKVDVLGTHFNIMAYRDENTVNTTLLEGKVSVSANQQKQVLNPGQQAQLAVNGDMQVKEVDVEEVIAWKNGLFLFQHADVKTIMQQLSRWYDIEIVYEGTPRNMRLNGEVYRSYNLSQVLAVLGATGLKFKIEGRQLNVIY